MAVICPTVTAFDLDTYRTQLERAAKLSSRLHIDLMDGEFAPTTSPAMADIWLSDLADNDIHLMYRRPMEQLERLIELQPHLVVLHIESEGDVAHMATHLREAGIKAGLALLAGTAVEQIHALVPCFDHVLVFSGDLGRHGGVADLSLLEKVRSIRELSPTIEIGWDGGINDQNIGQLVAAGVEVLNVGGYLQQAENPANAYATLNAVLQG